jgi:uncharacterized membrane protein YfcA
MDLVNWEYWYVFPFAILVAVTANASGFSGGVLFQPFFNFVLGLPIGQSIATGIATETVGMSSGAHRYTRMRQIDRRAAWQVLPLVLAGVAAGVFVFAHLPRDVLRFTVGAVVGTLAAYQLYRAWRRRFGTRYTADRAALRRHGWVSFLAGSASACTGTGVAELHQPLLEQHGGLATRRANATAIFIEAVADWSITLVNLSLGNLRFDILVFSASGVLIGAQLGAFVSPYLPDRLLKVVFSLCVLGIGAIYVVTALRALL